MGKRVFRWLTAVALVAACSVSAWAKPAMLIPGGQTVGIKLYSQGLVVTGFDQKSAARAAGLKKGDVILAVDGEEVRSAAALREQLDEERVVLTILRNGKETKLSVKPTDTLHGGRLGAYIRDSISGIGTVTYYDPDTGAFGALGHGVSDADTEKLLPLEAGVVVASSVAEVKKGMDGVPGELKGQFDVHSILGQVDGNTGKGIFGILQKPIPGEPLPLAQPDEVKTGSAVIRANVDGTDVQEYSVEILKIYPQEKDSGRNILLEITDQRLLSRTGGIVQGMSGSPIIQNGKLIGAVTHVLVNDPTRGYGIFIENMLEAAK